MNKPQRKIPLVRFVSFLLPCYNEGAVLVETSAA